MVCFIDIDVPDGIVHTRIFQDEKEANRMARYWVHGVLSEEVWAVQ